MTGDLTQYPQYKDSGLPWIGSVPSHWDMVPNRGIVRRRKVPVGEQHGDYRLLSLTRRGVIIRDTSTGKGKFSSDMGTSQEVRPGDFVFCLFDVPETPRTVGLSRHHGMITGAYTVFESLGRINSEYFELFYQAMDDRKLLSPLYSGMRHTIPVERFLGTKTPNPPPNEQLAITKFLNHANARIERAIQAKKKLIALLNEQKQAIIHRAVTRGLDSNVPLKPSGIPCLGDIPANWQPRKLKLLVSLTGGKTPTKSVERFWGGSIPWVSPKDMKVREIGDSRDHITQAAVDETSIAVIQPTAVLIVVRGMILARTFPVAITSSPVTINQDMKAIRTRANLDPDYLVYLLTGLQRELLDIVEIAGHGTCCLRSDSFENFKLPIPPLQEQLQISRYLKNQLKTINIASGRTECEIVLLQEYRTQIVSDVVTGKLDVREAALRLPEQAALEADTPTAADELEESELPEKESVV